jgi:hypothetical protein
MRARVATISQIAYRAPHTRGVLFACLVGHETRKERVHPQGASEHPSDYPGDYPGGQRRRRR